MSDSIGNGLCFECKQYAIPEDFLICKKCHDKKNIGGQIVKWIKVADKHIPMETIKPFDDIDYTEISCVSVLVYGKNVTVQPNCANEVEIKDFIALIQGSDEEEGMLLMMGDAKFKKEYITHWMPLPQPPKSEVKE